MESLSLLCGMGNIPIRNTTHRKAMRRRKRYAFEIKEDGQIIKATMTNAKIPEEVITTPKTGGDDSRSGLWIILSVLSVAGVTGFGILAARKCRRKKREGTGMSAKTWITIGLVVFIIGALIWLNLRNKKK